MARPHQTPEQKEETRSRIRQAAAEIYRSEGIAAISARSVALKAGVSVGMLYTHFGDLAGLMQSLWAERVEQQNARFQALAARHREPMERLRALLREYLRFGLKNGDLYRNAFLFVRPESHAKPAPQPLAAFDFSALLMAAIAEGQAAGSVAPGHPAQLAQMLWSGVHGCLALPMNIDRVAFAPTADIADAMAEALIKGISK